MAQQTSKRESRSVKAGQDMVESFKGEDSSFKEQTIVGSEAEVPKAGAVTAMSSVDLSGADVEGRPEAVNFAKLVASPTHKEPLTRRSRHVLAENRPRGPWDC